MTEETASPAQQLDPEFVDHLQQALSQVTAKEVGPITADREIVELGLDSVSMVEMMVVLEDELDITLEQDELEGLKTFGDLQALVQERRSS